MDTYYQPAKISVIIPTYPKSPLPYFRQKMYSKLNHSQYECLTIQGNNPSLQRNEGASKATGDIFYFLDDDACPTEEGLKKIRMHFLHDPQLAAVGGPAVPIATATLFEKAAFFAMKSFWGQAWMSGRFQTTGAVRPANEYNLICRNLAIRKEAWEKLKTGFDPRLYPNEENQLINRMSQLKLKMIFDPSIPAAGRFSKNFLDLTRRFLRYGKSRAWHFRTNPEFLRLSPCVPSFWVLYLISLAGLCSFAAPPTIMLWPLSLYLLCNLGFIFFHAVQCKNLIQAFMSAAIIPVMHISYGAGFLFGLLRGPRS